ncbi:MAG: outer membrane beta-barrel family protein [Salinimicrobium sp.]
MLNKFCLPIFSLLVLCSSTAIAQHSLEGKVLDNAKNPIAYANIILLSAEDSTTVYKGAVSQESGNFRVDNVENNTYLLRVSFIGFEDLLRPIEVANDTNLGVISLAESVSNLDEVSVVGKKPVIRKSIDRLTFDVENSTLSTGTTYELLKRTPGVIVSQGQLLVKNRPATVYINDRKVYLSTQELQQLLEGFSAGNVKSVEVITNPPAKYDAEGGAILNIRTSKNISIGYKGSLNANTTFAEVPKYGVGTSHYYKNDHINFFANYNFNYQNILKEDENYIVFYDPSGGIDSRWDEVFNRDSEVSSNSINAILDINLSENSSLNLSANLQLLPASISMINGQTDIYGANGQLDSLYTTNGRRDNDQENLLLSAAYNTSIGEKGATFSAVANYIDYDDNQNQGLTTSYFSNSGELLNRNSFSTIAEQKSEIYTGKIDVSVPGTINLETGLKYSGVKSKSGLDYFNQENGTKYVSELSDTFNYDENIYAAYLSASREFGKWSAKAGLRGEYTNIEGEAGSVGMVNKQDYFELFPTFYLMFVKDENNSFGLDYSRRISRPRFQSLNPYRTYINENNVIVGNPELQPGISNKINFNYTYKNKLSFDLYWDRGENATAVLPFQDNEAHLLRTVNTNLNYEQQYSLDVSYYDYVKNWWYLYFYSSFFYLENEFVAVESGNETVNNDVLSTYLMAQNFFTLSKDGTFSGELIATYMPKFIAGSYVFDEPQYGLSLGLRKTFLDSRLTTTLNVDDVFDTQNIPLTSRYLNQNNGFFAKPESRMLRVGVIYKFGNFKLRDNNRSIDADESERLKEKTVL